ncbi:Phosphoenolpyruvate carboxykinase [ATP] [compost metagenome]
MLNPRNTWENKEAYDQKANDLANRFIKNFEQFADVASNEMKEALPVVSVQV